MKKSLQILTILSAFSLLSCASNGGGSSSNGGESSSGEPTKEDLKNQIETFLNELDAFSTKPTSFRYESTQSDFYNAITIDTKAVGEKGLYTCSEVDRLLIDKYNYYQDPEDEESLVAFETQTYLKNDKLYILKHADDASYTDTKYVYFYDEETYGGTFDLSLQEEEKSILESYQSVYFERDDVKVFQSFQSIKGNGRYAYSYGVELYQEGTKTQSITYENRIVISNNEVQQVERKMVNNQYVSGQVINSTTSTTQRIYSYKEASPFEGTLFDSEDFQEGA